MSGRCGTCKKEWGASGQAHCRACHEHFNSDAAFDRHREGSMNDRACIPVERFAEPFGKAGLPRLVQTERKDGAVWVTALRDSGETRDD